MNPMNKERREEALAYLNERTGKLEYRFLRYSAVADELYAAGMNDSHLLIDVGAGMCDFDFYLRTVRGFKGRYLPIDASIDGVDLESYSTHHKRLPKADFVSCIEVLEHIHLPKLLSDELQAATRVRLVVTTPNTDELGPVAVREMDRTHVHPLYRTDLLTYGYRTSVHSFFGVKNDSIMGVYDA